MRLYPAMVVVVTSTAVLQYYLKCGVMPMGWGNNMANALLYVANWEPFGPHSHSIWDHTYSMSHQEQWYVAWSLCLPLMLKYPRRVRSTIMMLIIVLSYSGRFANAAGLLPTPLFGIKGFLNWIGKLQLGAFLRFSTSARCLRSRWSIKIGFALFFISLLDAYYGSDKTMESLGLSPTYLKHDVYSLFSSLFVSVLLVMGSIEGTWIFETQLLRFLGRISYSWFLFQVPLLHIVGWARNFNGFALTCVAFVGAVLSTLYIEEPIRDWNKSQRSARFKPKAVASS